MVYGHVAVEGEDPLIFGYPPYVLFPLMPLFFIPFQWTQAIWLAVLLVATILIPFLMFPHTPRWLPATIFLLYPFSFGLLMGNFAVPYRYNHIGYLLDICSTSEKASPAIDFIAGVALAWSTAKPQFIWLFLIFYFIAALKLKKKLVNLWIYHFPYCIHYIFIHCFFELGYQIGGSKSKITHNQIKQTCISVNCWVLLAVKN